MGMSFDDKLSGDHERFRMRQHIDYGWTEWYANRIVIEQDKPGSDSLEFRSISFENRFQVFEKDIHGWDGGFRINYGHSDGDKTPHELEARLMAQVPIGQNWDSRHNIIFEREVGADSAPGITLELRNQINRKVPVPVNWPVDSLKLGVESFNDFGKLNEQTGYSNQSHQIGPVMKAGFANGAFMQVGYRSGLSRDSADHLVKVFVGRDF